MALASAWWLRAGSGDPVATPRAVSVDPPAGHSSLAEGSRRSVLDGVRVPAGPADAETDARGAGGPPAAAPRPGRFDLVVAPQPALSGLEVAPLGASDRERLKVPSRYGTGVIITRIHPDAPAAEAGLRPGDVIVRAMREHVNGPGDLERVVADREHTVLIAARDGRLMQLVLQKPYDGS